MTDNSVIAARSDDKKQILVKKDPEVVMGIDLPPNCTDLVLQALIAAKDTNNKTDGQISKEYSRVIAALGELQPRDGFEGMLISQMLTGYQHAAECMRMSVVPANKDNLRLFTGLQKEGARLYHLYTKQLEALDKHRQATKNYDSGAKSAPINKVTVTSGGQAVIGSVL